MPAFLLGLLKYVPFVGKWLGDMSKEASRAAELKAEKEVVEAKAFARGRISPKYLMKYAAVIIFCLFSLGMLAHAFFPAQFPHSPLADMREMLKMAADFLLSGWW